jgi:hypothetical protein
MRPKPQQHLPVVAPQPAPKPRPKPADGRPKRVITELDY